MTLYMHKETSSIDTYENWIDDTSEGCSREAIDEAIQEGFLIEVELKYQVEGYSKISKLWSIDYIGDNNYFDLVDEAEEAIKYLIAYNDWDKKDLRISKTYIEKK